MKALQLCGENYYDIEGIDEFVECCKQRNEIIISVEFFKIIDERIVPYDMLQSIDSSELYDENSSVRENSSICNDFIKSCINKCFDRLAGLYFNATIES